MLLIEKKNRVCHLTLNRPEKRNALNSELVEELQNHLDDAFADNDIKLIVLAGKGESFCAGADLAMLEDLQQASYDDNLADSEKLARLFLTIRNGSKAVLAAVHGHALAGGCGLVGVCDISVASDQARFGYTETRIGFVPALVSKLLLEKVGETHAKKLLLSGEIISAEEAARIGLISEVVPPQQFEGRIGQWIDIMINSVSGEAVTQTKSLINRVAELPLKQAMREAISINAEARSTDDCRKGIRAFLDKEKIRW